MSSLIPYNIIITRKQLPAAIGITFPYRSARHWPLELKFTIYDHDAVHDQFNGHGTQFRCPAIQVVSKWTVQTHKFPVLVTQLPFTLIWHVHYLAFTTTSGGPQFVLLINVVDNWTTTSSSSSPECSFSYRNFPSCSFIFFCCTTNGQSAVQLHLKLFTVKDK